MNSIWSCLLQINETAKPKFETKFTNKLWVSDVIQLIEGAQCTTQTWINNNRPAAWIHANNYITLGSDLLHMAEILNIASRTSRTSRWMSWIRNDAKVAPSKSTTSGWIFMRWIAGRKGWHATDQYLSWFESRVYWWLRNREVSKLLDANR